MKTVILIDKRPVVEEYSYSSRPFPTSGSVCYLDMEEDFQFHLDGGGQVWCERELGYLPKITVDIDRTNKSSHTFTVKANFRNSADAMLFTLYFDKWIPRSGA